MVDNSHICALGSVRSPGTEFLLSEPDPKKREDGWMFTIDKIKPGIHYKDKGYWLYWPINDVVELNQLRDIYQYPFEDVPASVKIAAGKKLVDSLLLRRSGRSPLEYIVGGDVGWPISLGYDLASISEPVGRASYRNGCVAYLASDEEGLDEVKEYSGRALVKALAEKLEYGYLIELQSTNGFLDSTRKNSSDALESVVLRKIAGLAEAANNGDPNARQELKNISERTVLSEKARNAAADVLAGKCIQKDKGTLAPANWSLWKPKTWPVFQKKAQTKQLNVNGKP